MNVKLRIDGLLQETHEIDDGRTEQQERLVEIGVGRNCLQHTSHRNVLPNTAADGMGN